MGSGKSLLILTEAGEGIGFGHYTRCNAIREYCLSEGISVDFFLHVSGTGNHFPKVNVVNWRDEEVEFEKYSHVLIDSYLLPLPRIKEIAQRTDRLVVIDDYGRIQKDVDLIINPNLYGEMFSYKVSSVGGARYVILRKAFRHETRKVNISNTVSTVLITVGGSDIRGLLPRLVDMVAEVLPDVKIHLVAGSETYRNELSARIGRRNTQVHGFVAEEDMKELMLNTDIVISSCGQTLHELAWLGVPSIGICIGDDQIENMKTYVRCGFLAAELYWDQRDRDDVLKKELHILMNAKDRLIRSEKGKGIFSNDGLRNIFEVIFEQSLSWRYATAEDAHQYFDWANDVDVRRNAHAGDPIVWKNHAQWFNRKLAAPDTVMLMFFLGRDAVGQMRVEFEARTGLIDYSVDKKYRGKGLGKQMLLAIRSFVKTRYQNIVLIGEVKEVNIASCRAFEASGFSLKEKRKVNGVDCNIYQLQTDV